MNTEYINIKSPETNEDIAKVVAMKQSDIDSLFKKTKESQIIWSEYTISQRASYLSKWADNLEDNIDELANMLVLEIAKPLSDAKVEVIRTVEYIRYTIDEMYRIDLNLRSSEQFYGGDKSKMALTKQIPLGVVLAISPFNYPINLAVSKIAPALISGNTVMFKPATQGSVVGSRIIELLYDTGIDDNVVSVVTGRGSEIGDYLITHPFVDMISFTGGSSVGNDIAKKSSMIPLVLELGGKDAAIVIDNHDIYNVADDIIAGAFNYSAQRCTAIKRVLVDNQYMDELIDILKVKIDNLTKGQALDNKQITSLIDKKSADFVESLVEDALGNGSILHNEFKRVGNLIYPLLISNVKSKDSLFQVEPFGPILPIVGFDSIDEAINLANDSMYGLQASVYGRDIDDLMYIASKLDVGSVNINSKTSRGPDNFIFSGYKNSGMGAQGIRESILSMTKSKSIVINSKF